MLDLILAVVIFLSVVFCHLVICRYRDREKLYVREFLMLALFGLAVSIAGSIYLPKAIVIGPRLIITSVIFYILLIPTYLCFYVLTLLVSPSKKILSVLARGPLTKADIHGELEVEQFVQSRLADLLSSGLVTDHQGRLQLTAQGKAYCFIAQLFQSFIGRGQGG